MNRVRTWISSTLYSSIRKSVKSQFLLHTDSNAPKAGEPIKSFLSHLGFKREACWVDVRVPRKPTKTYSDRKPPKNCSFGVLCNRPPPKITRIMAKEIPRKPLPIETRSMNVRLNMRRKRRSGERSRTRTNEE